MSALSRIRPLAAALALLLFLTANAVAWTDKPMDNPEGPPIPKPQEVGEPDTGHGLPALWKEYLIAASLNHPVLRRLVVSIVRPRFLLPRSYTPIRGGR